MQIVRFDTFKPFPGLIHGVATAEFGNMSFNWGEYQSVRDNRKRFFDQLSVPESSVVVASLVHGNTVIDVKATDRGKGIAVPKESLEADIIMTSEPDTYLFMVVADCLALFLFEPDKNVCGLAHAGWKGVEARVPQVAVDHMVTKYGCDPSRILVGMSPARQAVSSSFPTAEVEQKRLPGWEPYLKEAGGHTEVDFVGYAYDQLVASGVPAKNIDRSPVDTRLDPLFFSHRRSVEDQTPEARFGCLIGITT